MRSGYPTVRRNGCGNLWQAFPKAAIEATLK
jgi:hypothetical protein